MAYENETWQWDDADAVESTPKSLYSDIDGDLMFDVGAATPQAAHRLFVGRPRLAKAERERSMQLQFKAPESMADYVNKKHNRSEYLHRLIARDMSGHGQRLQTM